jgi:myo-inositol-1(or 4)-monophosphatase
VQLHDFLQDLARGAGDILRDRYHTAKTWRTKTDRGDLVTEVDELAEQYIVKRISAEFPQDHILSEECGAVGGDGERTWIIDPIDGTRNYAIGIPFFCVSIGVASGGVVQAGAVYDPLHDEMFVAGRGEGAWLNGEPIVVSADDTLEDALVAVSWVRLKVDGSRYIRLMDELSRETSYFRRLGSAALMLAYVACGRFHCFVQGGLNPWDVAASLVLIEEAGGVVTDFHGRPIDIRNKNVEILAANPHIHSVLVEKLTGKR